MTNIMNSILSRVLSQEIAHQKQWMQEEEEMFGFPKTDREGYIQEIKQFMEENKIPFNQDWYFRA